MKQRRVEHYVQCMIRKSDTEAEESTVQCMIRKSDCEEEESTASCAVHN